VWRTQARPTRPALELRAQVKNVFRYKRDQMRIRPLFTAHSVSKPPPIFRAQKPSSARENTSHLKNSRSIFAGGFETNSRFGDLSQNYFAREFTRFSRTGPWQIYQHVSQNPRQTRRKARNVKLAKSRKNESRARPLRPPALRIARAARSPTDTVELINSPTGTVGLCTVVIPKIRPRRDLNPRIRPTNLPE
jgi:hypothetical protein